jgi:hypothetical protein
MIVVPSPRERWPTKEQNFKILALSPGERVARVASRVRGPLFFLMIVAPSPRERWPSKEQNFKVLALSLGG